MPHQVVLVPGFFGFGNLGDVSYFVGVREVLKAQLEKLGVAAQITEVQTLPTASVRYRAARVLEALAEVAARTESPIHVIGHSTGGLDARIAISPTASLPTSVQFEAYERVESLVTIATPHSGTPLAGFFGSAMGKPLLRVLALAIIYLLRNGRLPLRVGLRLGRYATRLDDYLGLKSTVLDQLYEQLLGDFSDDRRLSLLQFVHDISSDQSLLFQLTPAGCDLLNASNADPDRIRYGSVVTRARSPSLASMRVHGHNIYAQYLGLIYALLYKITAQEDAFITEPAGAQREALQRGYGSLPTASDNDGVVPTFSQAWGEIIHCAQADHLDVVGHYGRLVPGESYADWLPSNSGFERDQFQSLWRDVARFLVRGHSA